MEFILNKIDTDIRKRMQEDIKEGKVHSSKSINVRKDSKNKNSNAYEELEIKEKKIKRYITIDGIKNDTETMEISAEKLEKFDEENSKGRILDAKK